MNTGDTRGAKLHNANLPQEGSTEFLYKAVAIFGHRQSCLKTGFVQNTFVGAVGFALKRCSTRAGERRLPCQIDSWGGGAGARIYGIYE